MTRLCPNLAALSPALLFLPACSLTRDWNGHLYGSQNAL